MSSGTPVSTQVQLRQRLPRRHKDVLGGVGGGLSAVGDIQLLIEQVQVGLDGLFADIQFSSDLFVRESVVWLPSVT